MLKVIEVQISLNQLKLPLFLWTVILHAKRTFSTFTTPTARRTFHPQVLDIVEVFNLYLGYVVHEGILHRVICIL